VCAEGEWLLDTLVLWLPCRFLGSNCGPGRFNRRTRCRLLESRQQASADVVDLFRSQSGVGRQGEGAVAGVFADGQRPTVVVAVVVGQAVDGFEVDAAVDAVRCHLGDQAVAVFLRFAPQTNRVGEPGDGLVVGRWG